jgi:hypothetical protein
VYPTLAWTRLVRGDWDGVDDALAAWIGRAEAAPNSPFYRQSAWWIRLLAAAWRGDTATVDAAIAADPGEVDAPLPHVLGSTQRFAALAQVRSLTGADVPLERADRRLARAAGGGLVITDGLVFVVARARGLAAAATGEFDAAARHLADAVDAARAAGALPELAHALFDRARLGASATASDDQREAAQLAARLGMAPLSARLEAGSG